MSLLRVFTNPRNHIFKGVLVESVFKGFSQYTIAKYKAQIAYCVHDYSLIIMPLGEACSRTAGSATDGKPLDKEPLRKAKTPLGRLDISEKETTKDVLERFPDDVNPVTKEKGGPRGPEPTRFGDWERKGRCIDF